MAISVSIQFELVGEHPVLEVSSLISEAIIKSPTVVDAVPVDVFAAVLTYVSKEISLFAVSRDLTPEILMPIIDEFSGDAATNWQHNAANEDYILECGIADSKGNVEWLCTIQIVANCDEDEEVDEPAVTTETSNLH